MSGDAAAGSGRKLLGTCICDNCGYDKAQVREDKNGRAYVKCDECDYQAFPRSKRGDEKLRARLLKPAAAPATPAEEKKDGKDAAGGNTAPAAKPKSGFFV